MDPICEEVLIKYTKCPKLIELFDICGLSEVSDFVEINEDILDNIENYVHNFLFSHAEREKYFDPLYIFTQNEFLFSVGLRIKILRAVEEIKRINNQILPVQPESESEGVSWKDFSLTLRNSDILTVYDKNQSFNDNPFISINTEVKEGLLNKWVPSVIERISKKYPDLNLVFKKDFDLDFMVQQIKGEMKYSGNFTCKLCNVSDMKIIKFSFTKEKYLVLSNVINHLKLHSNSTDQI